MAKLLNKDPSVYFKEKERFVQDLKQFHGSRGSPFRTTPIINGKEIDLYQLYWLVTAQGGWEKVNRRNDWNDLLSSFDIPESTANGAILLKQTYLRYLDPYEKIHYLGEEEDREDDWYNDEEESRTRRQKAQKIQSTVPLSYHHNQHEINDEVRKVAGLSTNVYRKTDYDRLALSLTSPLPNEQDFGINVCTLLSNEGKHTLKLGRCPRLLDLLLAHAGVFNHHNMDEYLNGVYCESRKYDIVGFWRDVCADWSVRGLMLHPSTSTSEIRKRIARKSKSALKSSSSKNVPTTVNGCERLNGLIQRAEEEMSSGFADEGDCEELFASGRRSGTRELAGQRVLQIATILRNLSFEEDNAAVLSKNLTCLRFCLLCTSSKWSNVNQMGFDILSNIASEVELEMGYTDSGVTDVLLSTLTCSIASFDRFQVISSLDVLTKLCQLESNEGFIGQVITSDRTSVYGHLVGYLSLHDIHLLISALECLYALSCLGETTCNSIVRTQGALDALVSLMTVEAQSYGPKACILMRVVETVPGSSMSALPAGASPVAIDQSVLAMKQPTQLAQITQPQQLTQLQTAATAAAAAAAVEKSNVILQNSHHPPTNRSASPAVTDGPQIAKIRGQLVQIQRPKTPPVQLVQPQTNQPGNGTSQPSVPQTIVLTSTQPHVVQTQAPPPQMVLMQQQLKPPQPPPQQQQQSQPQQQKASLFNQQQQQQQLQPPQQQGSQRVRLRVCNDEVNRQFCLSWLKSTYEASPGSCIDQQVMYKQYLASLHKLGKRDVISGQHYALAVRTLFGSGVGPVRKQLTNGHCQNVFDGVKVRSQPLPLKVPLNLPAPVIQHPQIVQQPQQQQQQIVNNLQQVMTTTAATGGGGGGSGPLGSIQVVTSNGGVINNSLNQPIQIQQAQLIQHVYRGNVNMTSTTTTAPIVQASPTSPILTNLLHKNGSVGPQVMDATEVKPTSDTQLAQRQQQLINQAVGKVVQDQSGSRSKPESDENGLSVLDGILPKDFEEDRAATATRIPSSNGDGFKSNGSEGEVPDDVKDKWKPQVNGLLETTSSVNLGTKRPAVSEMGPTPAKRVMLDPALSNGMTVESNGILSITRTADKDRGSDVTTVLQQQNVIPQVVPQKHIVQTAGGQHIIVRQPQKVQLTPVQQQHLVTTAEGKTILISNPSSGEVGSDQPLVASLNGPLNPNPGSGKTVIILQPQNKVVQVGSGVPLSQPGNVSHNGLANGQMVQHHARRVSGGSGSNVVTSAAAAANDNSLSQRVESPSSSSAGNNVPSASQNADSSSPAPIQSASLSVPNSKDPLVQTMSPGAAAASTALQVPSPNPQKPFLCEWKDCMQAFKDPKEALNHAIIVHCPPGIQDAPCLWLRCDGMKRKRFSLMQHIMDRHCHPQVMKLVAVRRVQMAQSGRSDVPLPPTPPPHPGYAPNAAMHAIKRHAQEFVVPKAQTLSDEKEGPVTKSIRLTSSLILKNLVTYSSMGKRRLMAHESLLSTVALSNVESSRTVGQILFDMSDVDAL